MTRKLTIGAASYDEASRSCEAVVATGNAVARNGQRPDGSFGPWTEILDLDGADLSRFVGAPVLVDHRYDSDARVGVVTEVWRERERLVARLKFSSRPAADELVRDVRDGIASQCSVGYTVQSWERRP